MTAKNRAGLIAKLHTSLKKQYKPAPAAPGRPLLEHILYAALLEDAPVDLADEGFAKCEQEFFDWNEVRVTSVTELAEVLSRFPSPPATAARLKRCLQSVFEAFYNFDIDHLKKENLGKAVAKFEAMSGISPFVLAYLVQHGLGGHAIPVNSAAMHIMFKTGIVNEPEARTGKVPGLERAIPKSKAIEFSSMLHQAAVALQGDPLDKTVWDVILSVNKDAEVSAPKVESQRKSLKRPAAKSESGGPPAGQPAGKAGGKPKAGDAAKPAGGKATAGGKSPSSAKAASSGKSTSSGQAAEASKTPASTSSTSKASAKSAKPAAGKAASAGAAASDATARPAPGKTASGGKAAAKKSASVTPKGAKKAAPKSNKKTDSAPPAAKPAAGKDASKATPAAAKPAAGASKKRGPKQSDAAPTAAGGGNQKLTKRKPR